MDKEEIEVPQTSGLMDELVQGDDEKSELDKILEQFLDPRNIEHNTQLTEEEIHAFSMAGPLAEKYDLELLRQYIVKKCTYRVSKDRKGRQEWVKMASRNLNTEPERGGRSWLNFFKRD